MTSTAYISAPTRQVPTPDGNIRIADHPGEGPALVLMHGFPDDMRMYDRLVPLLAPRRVVTIDFLGYGGSDRPERDVLDAASHVEQLRAALDAAGVDRAVLVGHDASGPVAIDFAAAAPDRVSRLVLLNTYYGHSPTLKLPSLIRLLADSDLGPLADAMIGDPNLRLWLLQHTARQWGEDPDDPNGIGVFVLPGFFGDASSPDALSAVRSWTAGLFDDLDEQDRVIRGGHLAALDLPVTVVFGALDPFLNPGVAAHLAAQFSHADLRLVDGASHWPQWDTPDVVAQLLHRHLDEGS
jgi:pimeloyl-ACP methyl ester carboxylesterase